MEDGIINGAQGGVPEGGRQEGLVRADYVEGVDAEREEEMEAMREKIRQLESQLHETEEEVRTSPLRRDDRITRPAPAVASRQPHQSSLFQKVQLPSYSGEDPNLYVEFDRKISLMLRRDVTLSESDKKHYLMISLKGPPVT